MALITYADKNNNSISPLTADKKVSASDLNEIKTVVNTNRADHITLQNQVDNLEDIGGAAPLIFEYDDTLAEADPGTGKYRLDATLPSTVGEIYVSAFDATGIDCDVLLNRLEPNSYLYIQSRPTQKEGALYQIVTKTDNGTWFKFTVVNHDAVGSTFDNGDFFSMTLHPALTGGGGGGDVATDPIWDAKGDLAVGTANDLASKLTVGTNGQVLKANSSESTGLEWTDYLVEIGVQIGAFQTDLAVGTDQQSFRIPYDFTLTSVRAAVTEAPVGSTLVVDINKNGVTVLSTKLSIDSTETSSRTAATPPVISVSSFSDDDEVTFDIDQIGSTTAGQDLTVFLEGYRAI